MNEVSWTENSLNQLKNIREQIEKDSHQQSQLMIDRLLYESTWLKLNPRIGRIVPEIKNPEIREILKGTFRVIYLYQDQESKVIVLAVHQSMKDLSRRGYL